MENQTAKLKETRLLLNLYPVNSLRLGRIEPRLKVEGKTRTWWINAAIREKLDKDHPETNKPEGEYVPAPLKLDTPEEQARYQHMVEHMTKILASFTPAVPLKGMEASNGKWHTLSEAEKSAVADAAEKLASADFKESFQALDLQESARKQWGIKKILGKHLEISLREAREAVQANTEDKAEVKSLQAIQEAQEALEAPLDGENKQIYLLAAYMVAVHGCGEERAFEFAAIAKGQEMTAEEKARIMARHYAVKTVAGHNVNPVAPVEASPLVNVASEPEDFWGEDKDWYSKIKRKAGSRI